MGKPVVSILLCYDPYRLFAGSAPAEQHVCSLMVDHKL